MRRPPAYGRSIQLFRHIGTAHPGAEAAVASRGSDRVQIVDPVAGKTGWIHSASWHQAPRMPRQERGATFRSP